ncbi:neuroblast differentiation-associated protein AHNAK isoform X10 [Etheostoma cragini]|uniref:neuroblast differentiation-associated protein AHNAK isoform X10 n=1 Tax=Etheostoma cragini TaxID=417921 RepID=UPI00155EF2FE|nr:neuroblast differentiation-associated protein AHNAK isoform X10 [Etheostoma cragini]
MGTTEAKVDLQGPEIKGGKTEMPSIDISLPKGKSKGEVDIEGKGGKFKMPSCNIHLPKMKLSEGEVVLKGPEINGGKIEMPTVDISVPQGKEEGDLDIGGSEVKGGNFNMPSLDISLPKSKLLEGDMKLECPEIPNVDFSLPKANVEGNIELEGSDVSGDRFKMPAFDISFPKRKKKEGEVDIERPEVKGGTKFNMPSLSDISPPAMKSPSVDISIPKGKVEGDIETKGKREHFHIPSIDVSLPEIKSKRGDINIEGPEIKGGGIKMPTIDISTPQGSLEGDITVEGEGKEGKFSLPSVDITLPAVKYPEGDVNFQGPKVKGWKYEMPKVDLSLPKGKVQGDIDIDIRSGKDGNIEIPSYHTGLPKGKFKGPELKGGKIHMPDIDLSLPKGKMEKPTIDISLSKGKLAGDVDIDGHGGKGGKFHMPSLDISIPKIKAKGVEVKGDMSIPNIKSPEVDFSLEGPDVKGGKVNIPTVDISLPKGKVKGDINVEGPEVKGGTFKMPTNDVALPKVNLPEGDVKIKGPGIKGGKIEMPDIDLSLPKGKAKGEIDIGGHAGKGGKFHMPSVDISLPKLKAKGVDVSIEGPDLKGGKNNMPNIDLSLPKGNADLSIEGPEEQGGKFKMPDIKIPDIDFSFPKGKTGEIDGGHIGVNAEGGKMKMSHMKMSDVDISLPKGKIEGPEMEIKGEGGKFKMPHFSMPSVDISLPKGKTEGPDIEMEGGTGGKFKMPHMKMPDVDISLPKGKIEGPEMEIKGQGGQFKMPHLSMPSVDISLPKGKIEGPEIEIEGGTGGKFKMPHMKMPSIDISLPKGKIEGPDVEIEGSTGGKLKMPHLKMPDVDISLPKGNIEGPEKKIKGDGGKFKMPHFSIPSVDISLPKGTIEGPDIEMEGGTGGKFKMPHAKMPKIDVSHPKGKIEVPDVEMEGGTGGKFKLPHWKMPDFYISLPKGKIEGPDTEIEGGTGGKFKMPKVDISLPKRKPSVEGPELDIGGHFKMPNVGISIPKGKESIDIPEEKMASDGGTIQLPHVNVPKVDISLPKGKSKAIEATAIEMEVTGGKFVGPHIKLPKEGVSVLKNKSGEGEINLSTAEAGGKVKVPQVPSLDLDIDVRLDKPKQDTEAHGEADLHVKGEHKALKLKMPTIDIKGPKGDLELDIGLNRGEGNKDRKKIELPDLDLNTTGTNSKVKGSKVKGTKFKIGMPKKKTGRDVTAEAKICKNCGDEEIGGKTKHRCMGKERFEYDVKLETHNGHKENKDRINIPVPEVTLPTKQGSAELGTGGEGSLSSSRGDSKVPRIPDIEFDITTSPDKYEDTTEKGKKIKIPKFGVALPSMSSPEGKINIFGPEIQYEGPKMPKVKKAVFVLVNPPQTGDHAACTGLQEKETTPGAEKEDVKVKMPKIKMKPSFGKPKDNAAALSFSPCKSGSFDVNLRGKGSTSSLNAEKDACPLKSSNGAKGTSSGKIKFPKVELTSPYGKMAAEGEDTEMSLKLGKDSSPGEVEGDTKGLQVQSGKMAVAGFSEELSKDVVSSRARTDMLDRDSSESPASFTMEFSSAKVQSWSKVESHSRESEERESSPWFKVPKFTLKPHSTGFLQITPEGSPQAQRKGEVGGEADVLGSFCLHTSGLDFTTQDVSEENQVCSTEDGTVTMVTKTTRITRHMVTSEAQTGESSATTTTTHQVSDFKH